MTTLYIVADWDKHFENNRSRGIIETEWVPIPNKQDGDGYTELLDHPNGSAHYGAACAIILLASKCHPRGILVRDGGRPHDMASMARITRIPRTVIEEATPRLISIGWITTSEIRQEGAAKRHPGAVVRARAQKGMEGNGKEEKTPLPPTEVPKADPPETAHPPVLSEEDEFIPEPKRGTGCSRQDAGFLIGEMRSKLKTPQSFRTIHDHIIAAMEQGITSKAISEAISDDTNKGKNVWDVLKPMKKRTEKMSRGAEQAARVMEKLNANAT